MHDLVCKPSAGKRHARFDERLLETERWLGLRHWRSAKAASNSFPHCPYLHRASSRLYHKIRYYTKFRGDALGVAKIRLKVRPSLLGNFSTQFGIETELLV